MKHDLDRLKKDVDTIHSALGLPPTIGRNWIQWLKRDKWFSLWWCLPGLILVAAALLPLSHQHRYAGLVPDQWAGLLVAASLLGIAIGHSRRVTGADGRPEEMIRESKRLNGFDARGIAFGGALLAQIAFYIVWSLQHRLSFQAFWPGLFLTMGSTCLVTAVAARTWILLGYAIPFAAYGLCLPLASGQHALQTLLFGLMFLAVALSFSLIQSLQIQRIERQNESH